MNVDFDGHAVAKYCLEGQFNTENVFYCFRQRNMEARPEVYNKHIILNFNFRVSSYLTSLTDSLAMFLITSD